MWKIEDGDWGLGVKSRTGLFIHWQIATKEIFGINSMKRSLKSVPAFIFRFPLTAYFVIAYAISWLIWLPLVFDTSVADGSIGPRWWLHYLGGFGPMLSAFLVSSLLGGKEGAYRLFDRLFQIGSHARWVVVGFFLPFLLFLFLAVAVGIVSGTWIDIGLLFQTEKLLGVGLLGIFLFEVIAFGFGEEVGWRGFALPRLQGKYHPLIASAVLSIFWAIWHVPAFFYNPNMSALGVGGTIGWIFSLFTGSIILAWLVNKSEGSILPVALFHGALDVVFISRAVAGTYDMQVGMALVVFSIFLAVTGHAWKPRVFVITDKTKGPA